MPDPNYDNFTHDRVRSIKSWLIAATRSEEEEIESALPRLTDSSRGSRLRPIWTAASLFEPNKARAYSLKVILLWLRIMYLLALVCFTKRNEADGPHLCIVRVGSEKLIASHGNARKLTYGCRNKIQSCEWLDDGQHMLARSLDYR